MGDPLTAGEVWLRLLGGVLGGLLVSPLGYVVNDLIGRRLARRRLLVALRKEATGAREAVGHMQRDISETIPVAEKIFDDVKEGRLSFEDLNQLFSGWIVYVPAYPLIETITKLHDAEINPVIRYFDVWNQVAAMEKSYSLAHAKLVELSSKIEDKNERTRICETASQVRGCLRQLINSASRLIDATDQLLAVTEHKEGRTRWLLRKIGLSA